MTLTLLPGYTLAKSPLDVTSMAVSANGAVMAVGYYEEEGNGCVVLYDLVQEVWVERNVLFGSYTAEGFGTSVALNSEGNILVVGRAKHLGTQIYGSISTYERINGVWTKTLYDLRPYEFLTVTGFGSAISVSGDGKILVVGISAAYSGYGCVYTYVRSGTSWNVLFPALISPAGVAHAFGLSVVVSEDGKVLIASTRCISSISISGFYVFDIGNTNWIQRGAIYQRTRTKAFTASTTASLKCSFNKNILVITETEFNLPLYANYRHIYVVNNFDCVFDSTQMVAAPLYKASLSVVDNNDVITSLSIENPTIFPYASIFERYRCTYKGVSGKIKLGEEGCQARVQVVDVSNNSVITEMVTENDGLFHLNLTSNSVDIDVIIYKQDNSVFDSLGE